MLACAQGNQRGDVFLYDTADGALLKHLESSRVRSRSLWPLFERHPCYAGAVLRVSSHRAALCRPFLVHWSLRALPCSLARPRFSGAALCMAIDITALRPVSDRPMRSITACAIPNEKAAFGRCSLDRGTTPALQGYSIGYRGINLCPMPGIGCQVANSSTSSS